MERPMVNATRFVIEDEDPPALQNPRMGNAARRAIGLLPWLEFAVLIPSKLLGVLGWLALPLVVFAVVPIVLLGTLLIAQAPIFFLMWKLFGSGQPGGDGFGRDKLAR
jgi:hypothetical protein